MNDAPNITVRPLGLADANQFAPLLSAYTQERRRGAPPAPDRFYAEKLLNDPVSEIIGAYRQGQLVGFAVFFDLPDTMNGLRAGQLDDLFVIQSAREHGVGRVLVDTVLNVGRRRDWTHLRWMVPERPPKARLLAEKLAHKGGWESYVVRFERESHDG